MFTVADIQNDIKRVLGGCSDDEMYSRLNHAIEILSTEGEFDPMLGFVDICSDRDGCFALPREVGTVLAVNICGRPATGHNWLFEYHLNGPGDVGAAVGFHWHEQRHVPTFRQLHDEGSRLVIQLEKASDTGKSFRVYGYAAGGGWVRTLENGEWVDGFLVPMTFGSSVTNPNAPLLSRTSRIEKAETDGYVRLYAVSKDGTEQYRVGNYAPDEIRPEYRYIQASNSCGCSHVRVAFKKNVLELSTLTDLIPLHSKYALVLMVKSLRKMDEDRLEEADNYWKKAIELLNKKQLSISPPTAPSIQMADGNLIADRKDRLE
jgi:hypothetical protein